MKKILCIVLAFFFAFGLVSCKKDNVGFESPKGNSVTPVKKAKGSNEIRIFINEEELKLSAQNGYSAAKPYIENDRVMVPIRAICEEIDCDIKWNDEIKTAVISKGDIAVTIKAGDDFLIREVKDSETEEIYLDAPATIQAESGSVFVPVRAISESFDLKVSWDAEERCVNIVKTSYDYDKIWNYSEGYAVVSKDGKCGFVDVKGREVIKCIYDNAWDFKNGFAVVEIGGKHGFIDIEGNEIAKDKNGFIYDDAWSFTEDGLAKVELDGKIGYIDTTGKLVVECMYVEAEEVSEETE